VALRQERERPAGRSRAGRMAEADRSQAAAGRTAAVAHTQAAAGRKSAAGHPGAGSAAAATHNRMGRSLVDPGVGRRAGRPIQRCRSWADRFLPPDAEPDPLTARRAGAAETAACP